MSMHLVGTIVNQALVETLGWILLHSVWQLAVVAALTWIAGRLLRRASSSSRYLLQLFSLVLMCGCPVVTWLQMPELSDSVAMKTPEEDGLLTKQEPGDAVLPAAGVDGSVSASDVSLKDPRAIAAMTRPSPTWREQVPTMLRPWLGTMVVAWSTGVLVFSLRPVTGWVSVCRLRTRGTSAVPQSVHKTLRELCARLQIRRRVDVMASTVVSSPIVIGCFRSLILLPASFAASVPVSQLEAILAHELAHVKRYDYFVNLLQTLMETLFFYHPAVWWLSHRIRIEREHCCDDLVVNVLDNRVDYGRALLAVEEYRTQFMTLAMNAGGGSLLTRVRRILSRHRDDARQDTSGVLAFVGLLVCTLAGLSWSAAVAGNDEAAVTQNDEKVEKGAASTEGSRSDERSVSAVLTEDLSVELLAIHEHRQSTEEDRKSPAAPEPVWRGNGEVYTVPPELPPWLDTSHRYKEGARHVLFRFKGLSENQHVGCRADGIRFVMNPDETGIVRAVVEPDVSSSVTSFRLGVTDVDWGPWIKVDPEGKEQEGVEIPAACRDVYNRIGVSHINLRGGESQFVWLGLRGVDDTAQSSLVAVDKDGKRWPMSAASFEGGPAKPLLVEIFNLPPEKLDHFEFRLRPYRHWVTFEDVSLKPGHKTTPRVKMETVPVTDLKAPDAESHGKTESASSPTSVPDRFPVKLLGVRSLDNPHVAWSGEGKMVSVGKDWPQPLRVANGDQSTHDFVISCQGVGDDQTILFDDIGGHRRFTTPTRITSPSVFSFAGNMGNDTVVSFRLGLTNAWGPWQPVDADGTLRVELEMTDAQRNAYSRLKRFHVMHDLIGLEGIAGDMDFDYEVTAVDTDGVRHGRTGAGFWNDANASVPYFDLTQFTLDHWEFRLRPVRQWVTFRKVSLKAGESTDLQISVADSAVFSANRDQLFAPPVPETQGRSTGSESKTNLFPQHGNLTQVFAETKKAATEKQQRIAIIVAAPDSDQARWFHALLMGSAEERKQIAVDEESLKVIRDAIREFHVLWLDAAQFDDLKTLIPDHEFEERHASTMVILDSDGSWRCHFEPDLKNEPERSLKNLCLALEHQVKIPEPAP